MNNKPSNEKKAVYDGLLELFNQHRRWVLFFGTGTSCDLDTGFGMAALQKCLGEELREVPEWARVDKALQAGSTLEQALDGTDSGLTQDAKRKFRQVTGDYVASVDQRYSNELLAGSRQWVGTNLLMTLLGRLPPANPRLSVITSNYDMLIEYACSSRRIRWTTGFVGDLTRTWNWDAAQDALLQSRGSRNGARGMTELNRVPRVELFKVHGSVNRFTRGGEQIECDLWSAKAPSGFERDVAIPGGLKYQQHAESNADTVYRARQAIEGAHGYLMIGYGFNDPHLHDKIVEQVRLHDRPLIVMTQKLDPEAIEKLRQVCTKVWILLACPGPDGSCDPSRTRVYMPGCPEPMDLDGEQLWKCDVFTERILGG